MRRGASAVVLWLALIGALVATACASEEPEPPELIDTPATATKSAEQRMPDLFDLGFEPIQSAPEPFGTSQWEGHRTLYRRQGSNEQLMVIAYVAGEAKFAAEQFEKLAAALRNPPAGEFGAQAVMVDEAAPAVGEERRGYRARDPDSQGNTVWTDIYRQGAVVVIVQYLGPASGDSLPVRTAAATRAMQ